MLQSTGKASRPIQRCMSAYWLSSRPTKCFRAYLSHNTQRNTAPYCLLVGSHFTLVILPHSSARYLQHNIRQVTQTCKHFNEFSNSVISGLSWFILDNSKSHFHNHYYTVFHKIGTPLYFFNNILPCGSISIIDIPNCSAENRLAMCDTFTYLTFRYSARY